MHEPDKSRFKAAMEGLAEVFGKAPPTQSQLLTFWEALKDLPWEIVEMRIKSHIRYHKFFPRPFELRPKEEKAPQPQDNEAINHSERESVKNWEDLRIQDPVAFWTKFADAYIARLSFKHEPGTPEYRQALERCVMRCNRELRALAAPPLSIKIPAQMACAAVTDDEDTWI